MRDSPVFLVVVVLASLVLGCTGGGADDGPVPRDRPAADAPPPAPPSPPPVVEAALEAFDDGLRRRRAAMAEALRPLEGWRRDRERLAHLVGLDQYVRTYEQSDIVVRFDATERRSFDAAFLPRWRAVDEANTRALKEMLDEHGWFTRSAFGPSADADAWLLAQHADHDVAFQRDVLARLEGLAARGETDPRHHAYLWDRVAVAEGRPQRFGTQGRCVGPGAWRPHPIEDEETVDDRRAEVGLEPMAAYVARFAGLCG